jgi:hypothetical protein
LASRTLSGVLAEDFDDAWASAPAKAWWLVVCATFERALAAAAVVAVAVDAGITEWTDIGWPGDR